jgi:hypothetical protein
MPYERIVRLANMINIFTSLAVPTALVWAVGGDNSSGGNSDAVCSPSASQSASNNNAAAETCCDDGRIAILQGLTRGTRGDPMAASVLIFATIILFMKLVTK